MSKPKTTKKLTAADVKVGVVYAGMTRGRDRKVVDISRPKTGEPTVMSVNRGKHGGFLGEWSPSFLSSFLRSAGPPVAE